jgi:hypothetical protein
MKNRTLPVKTRILFLFTLLCAAIASLQGVHAATITVTNTNDSGTGSLRQALAGANDGDMINFSVTGAITLTSGELVVNNSLTISGPGAANLAVNGNAASRVFHISSGKTVAIFGLTITNGHLSGNGNFGAGIYNDHATLTVSNCTISGNSDSVAGGGIFNNGSISGSASLTVNNSTISGNSVDQYGGGGIFNNGSISGSATLTVNNSTIRGNSAGSAGSAAGGIFNDGRSSGSATLTVNNSTISGNSTAGYGGGIANFSATLHLTDTILNAGASSVIFTMTPAQSPRMVTT